jgi:hypothetical protein
MGVGSANMRRRSRFYVVTAVLILTLSIFFSYGESVSGSPDNSSQFFINELVESVDMDSISVDYFITNRGQIDSEDVRYYSNTGGIFFTDTGIVLKSGKVEVVESDIPDRGDPFYDPIEESLGETYHEWGVVLKFEFVNSNLVIPKGSERCGWNNNYFRGSDPEGWHTDVPNYREIVYRELWDGIDLVYRLKDGNVKYDLILNPGADPDDIRFKVFGHESLSISRSGDLVFGTDYWDIFDSGLYAYQGDESIDCFFRLMGEGEYGFSLGAYDTGKVLVVDPILDYSSFFGGANSDECLHFDLDDKGDIYLTGLTNNGTPNFPTTTGSYDTSHNGNRDAFIMKIKSDGSSILYSTFLGGNADDIGVELVVDSVGNAFLAGRTEDGITDFPTTSGAFDTTHNGNMDAFLAKINQSGSKLDFSTFIGGSTYDGCWGICLDNYSNAILTGNTEGGAPAFPTTSGAFDTSHNGQRDVFVTKVKSDGSGLIFSTFIGGNKPDTGHDIAIDSEENIYVTGTTESTAFPTTTGVYSRSNKGQYDVILFKMNKNGNSLFFSTYFGSTKMDYGRGICLDSSGNSYITGYCSSSGYPTTTGAFDTSHNGDYDIFVTKVNSTGGSILYSTFLGGGNFEWAQSIVLKDDENAVITGLSTKSSNDYPVTSDAYDSSNNGRQDSVITILNKTGGSLVYSTFMGGTDDDAGYCIDLRGEDDIIICGRTDDGNQDYPVSLDALYGSMNGVRDGFLTILSEDHGIPTFGNDTSESVGTTGDSFSFGIEVDDDVSVSSVHVEYWFGTGLHTNLTMSGSGPFTGSISVPSQSLDDLHYIFRASDTSGNWANTSQKNVSILDNDMPTFVLDASDSIASTGDGFDFSVYLTDNIEVDDAFVEYWFGNGSRTNSSMNGISPRILEITIPEDSNESLRYIFHANDTSDNWMKTEMKEVSISDNDIPVFLNDSSSVTGTTGEDFRFEIEVTDNIEVAKVEVEYWFNNESSTKTSMQGEDIYGKNVTISENAVTLSYVFHAQDTSFNNNHTDQVNITISDNDPPLFDSDLTPPTGTTGDTFTFDVLVSDNIEVDSVYVEYWFGTGKHTNSSMTGSSPYTLDVTVPDDAVELFYIFRASDTSGNWAENSLMNVSILDNDIPFFGEDLTPSTATTGDPLTFSINVSDNLEVMSVHVEYWIGTGPRFNLTTSNSGTIYSTTITVPSDSLERIRYIFHAVDASGNWAHAVEKEILVFDNDRPVFGIDNSDEKATTGDPFTFSMEVTDNIEVSLVKVEYWFHPDETFNTTMLGTGPYSISANIPSNATSLSYIFHAVDGSGNWAGTPLMEKVVFDNDRPVFGADNTSVSGTTGEDFRFEIEVTDNIEVSSVYVEFWFGESYRENRSMEFDSVYHYTITLPVDSIEPLRYRFLAVDGSGNWVSRFRKDVNIIDNDDPVLTEDLSDTEAYTGDTFTFSIETEDNIAISEVSVEYWFGSGDHTNVSLESGDPMTYQVTVPEDSLESLHYIFHISDTGNNWIMTEVVSVIVEDNDPPALVEDHSPMQVNTGDQIFINAEAEDNIGIDKVMFIWKFGSEGSENTDEMSLSSGLFNFSLDIPVDSVESLIYSYRIIDTSDLETETLEHTILVVDNIPPTIDPIDDLTTYEGGKVKVKAQADDNIGVTGYEWTGTPFDVSGEEMSGITLTAGEYEITVEVSDAEGNSADTSFHLRVYPEDHDTDGDRIPDLIEMEWGLLFDDPSDGALDADSDGMNNTLEYLNGTLPFDEDTDDDGMPDGWEDGYGLDPVNPSASNDEDGDGRSDLEEYEKGSNPLVKDVDDDESKFPFLLVIIVLVIIVIAGGVIVYLLMGRKKEDDPGLSDLESGDREPMNEDKLETDVGYD